jgi:hypothetical protein
MDLFQRVLIDTASISALIFHGMRTGVLFMNYRTELPKFEFKREEEAGEEEENQEKDSQNVAEPNS